MSIYWLTEEGSSWDLIRLDLSSENEHEPVVLASAYKPCNWDVKFCQSGLYA